MEPLKRIEVTKEIVKIFEDNKLCEDLDKFWVLSCVSSAITSIDDPIRVIFEPLE